MADKDRNRSMLFNQPGHIYHGTGFHNTELRHAAKLKERNTVALFGRFGEAKQQVGYTHPEGGFVTVWRYKQGDYPDDEYDRDSNYGFNRATIEDVKTFLRAMMGQFPMKVIGQSPARLPITKEYVFSSPIAGATTVAKFLGVQGGDDICQGMKVNVQGRATAIADIMGQLHMVRGQQLGFLKGAFCSQYQGLKASPEYKNCTLQHRQMDDIANTLKCGDNDYYSLLQQGRADYRQRLRNVFRDPHKIGQEFRTQKEIDAAWDELQQGKREHLNFREWYQKWNGSGCS